MYQITVTSCASLHRSSECLVITVHTIMLVSIGTLDDKVLANKVVDYMQLWASVSVN